MLSGLWCGLPAEVDILMNDGWVGEEEQTLRTETLIDFHAVPFMFPRFTGSRKWIDFIQTRHLIGGGRSNSANNTFMLLLDDWGHDPPTTALRFLGHPAADANL